MVWLDESNSLTLGFAGGFVGVLRRENEGPGIAGPLASLVLCSLLLWHVFNRIENARSGLLHVLETL